MYLLVRWSRVTKEEPLSPLLPPATPRRIECTNKSKEKRAVDPHAPSRGTPSVCKSGRMHTLISGPLFVLSMISCQYQIFLSKRQKVVSPVVPANPCMWDPNWVRDVPSSFHSLRPLFISRDDIPPYPLSPNYFFLVPKNFGDLNKWILSYRCRI